MSGHATSDASSRLALQGGAVATWSRGCSVVATWLRVETVIVDQRMIKHPCRCAHVFGHLCLCYTQLHVFCVFSSLLSGGATFDASSRLALQGGAVSAWSCGCLVVATWLRADNRLTDQSGDCKVTALSAHRCLVSTVAGSTQ